MPTQIKEKVIDPEAELNNVQRRFQLLAPMCSVARRAEGEPQFTMQEKQMGILNYEMDETVLCIKLASKGQHAVRDAAAKNDILTSIVDFENLISVLRDQKSQETELNVLNYIANKQKEDLRKQVPTDIEELAMLENSNNRLRRMENRLDIATKRFCTVNYGNEHLREEINRLLVERQSFNLQWNRTIGKLLKGRSYLMDIFEIATAAFGARDEICRKLETLKWRGLFQLNKDIAEMQSYEGELNHLAKLEEFLRTKGTTRICEADEIEEAKRQEEIVRCEQEIAKHDAMLNEIFEYAGTHRVAEIKKSFDLTEKKNFSIFVLMVEVMQEAIYVNNDLEKIRQQILDSHDQNEARQETQERTLADLTNALNEQRMKTQSLANKLTASEMFLNKILKGIDELVKIAKCDVAPLLQLLGNHLEVTKYNMKKFLSLLEVEVKSRIEMAYSAVKPPGPTPRGLRESAIPLTQQPKLVVDPHVEAIRPNKIDRLVPYNPCVYCVEDYIMNLVFETPATPADEEFIQTMFHLEDVNTKFGIYTLTIPASGTALLHKSRWFDFYTGQNLLVNQKYLFRDSPQTKLVLKSGLRDFEQKMFIIAPQHFYL